MTKANWYVAYTKPRCELKVTQLLTRKHIKNYCPLHFTEKSLFDAKTIILTPLFNSYVFVYIHEHELSMILNIPGVINCLYWLNRPATIAENEKVSISLK
jgi:transcription antitermination factor NusG